MVTTRLKKLKMSLLLFFAGILLLLGQPLAAETIFHENFEQPEKTQFDGLTPTADSPGEGHYSGHLAYPQPQKSDVALAVSKKLIRVKPDTWYKMKVRHKNDIKLGEVKFGLIESRSATERKVNYYDWRWRAIPLNITEWKDYEMEFKTAANTHGVQLYLRTENSNSGSSWWDNISIAEFTKEFAPIELKPFRAAGSFTDIPTQRAYMVTAGDPEKQENRMRKTSYHWETLHLEQEKLVLGYRDLPPGSVIAAKLLRGEKVFFSDRQKVAGSGTLDYQLKLNTLPEGIYLFQAKLINNSNQTVCTQTKEIWRIDSRKSQTPQRDPVQTTTVGPNRQRLLNGKIYAPVYTSASPTWGLLSHHRQNCKPDLETYLKTMREQFGQDLFPVWYWRGPQWDSNRQEFVKKAIANYREYLNLLAANHCYGRASFAITAHRKEGLNFEEIRQLVRGVKDHPALLEWYFDEPEVHKYTPEEMIKVYQIIKEEDPNHIVNVNLCDPYQFHLYAPATDIASYDVYPFPGTSLLENRKRTSALLKAFPKAPFDTYLQMFNFNTLEMPTFDQVRATFILDRITGSHSLIAYAWDELRKSFLNHPELQSHYRAIVSMFRRLEPVLANGKDQQLNLKSSTGYVESRALNFQGETIILLVNISPDTPADVTIDFPAPEAEDFFDPAWRYHSRNGKFSFKLKPVETKVLRLKKQ